VVTAAAQADLVKRSLPALPAENCLIEPEMRDTAGAVAYAAGAIARKIAAENIHPDSAIMLVLPGDHVIRDLDRFAVCARTAAAAAVELKALMTFGIVPRGPVTGYGYVQRGAETAIAGQGGGTPAVYNVAAFKEKPDLETAEKYVASGEYFWNGGIFAWQLSTLRNEYKSQLPGHEAMIEALSSAANSAEWNATAKEHFPKLKKTSIDFGLMEGAKKVATVRADFDWDDIGSWSAVGPHLPEQENNRVAEGTKLLNLDSKNNILFAPGKKVALVGVEGLAIIQTGNDLLICRLERDQDVKKVNEMAKKP
jgi:mannose-1-phosphate guanylyltransferase